MLGGLAHSAGVIHFSVVDGVPDANRVMLDVWIAEPQLLAGAPAVEINHALVTRRFLEASADRRYCLTSLGQD